MINKEDLVFETVATALRDEFPGIYVIGTELSNDPPRFPAVTIVQSNNSTQTAYSTFGGLENVVSEEYKAEVFSNLEQGKEKQTAEITEVISDAMLSINYVRTFCEFVPNMDATISRKVSRYSKNNVI